MIWTPKPHQEIALDWMLANPRCGLFLAPGLGKSSTTLAAIEHRIASGESKGALVISPLRVSKVTWVNQTELWDHSSYLRHVNLTTDAGVEAWERGSADIYNVHFDVLSSRTVNTKCRKCGGRGCQSCHKGCVTRNYPGVIERLMAKRKEIPVDTIVIDESSFFKDPGGKRLKAVRSVIHHFKYRILLTGTPVCNSYLDLHSQIKLLDDGERLGKSFHQFRQTYFESDFMGYRFTIRPGAKEKIDAKIADICLSMSAEDWLKVPDTSVEDIEVTLPPKARRDYAKLEKELLLEIAAADGDVEIEATSAAVLAGKLLQFTAGSVYDMDGDTHPIHDEKLKALTKLRQRLGDEPLLVLTSYKHERARVMEALADATPFHEKDMDKWRRGEIRTWVADYRELSHGIDGIQDSCRHIVWTTPPWSASFYAQANARIIRQGQQHESVIHRLIARDTIDDAVIEALREKDETASGLMVSLKNLQRMRVQ